MVPQPFRRFERQDREQGRALLRQATWAGRSTKFGQKQIIIPVTERTGRVLVASSGCRYPASRRRRRGRAEHLPGSTVVRGV